jgi:5-methylcytosine-specific restriction endonuclease McrA
LSDRELLSQTARAAAHERAATASLLALLAEVDARRLYLGEGCSSLFAYCTRHLHMSEPAAYSRITAARVARRCPGILDRLASGDITLTSITLLSAHITDENCESLLDAARHRTKREVEHLVAAIDPKLDDVSSLRRLPTPATIADVRSTQVTYAAGSPASAPSPALPGRAPDAPRSAPAAGRSASTPLTPDRYLLKVTIARETQEALERARDLLRHAVPSGDLAVVIDRAVAALLRELERTKVAATTRPRRSATSSRSSRHIPAAVRRAVWRRDEGRCAFIGARGRCSETAFLEFHHVVPFADGGPADVGNIQLRCRAHNVYEGELHFGAEAMARRRALPPPHG